MLDTSRESCYIISSTEGRDLCERVTPILVGANPQRWIGTVTQQKRHVSLDRYDTSYLVLVSDIFVEFHSA